MKVYKIKVLEKNTIDVVGEFTEAVVFSISDYAYAQDKEDAGVRILHRSSYEIIEEMEIMPKLAAGIIKMIIPDKAPSDEIKAEKIFGFNPGAIKSVHIELN